VGQAVIRRQDININGFTLTADLGLRFKDGRKKSEYERPTGFGGSLFFNVLCSLFKGRFRRLLPPDRYSVM